MAQLLKQSTTVTIRLGPALDRTDGVTEETGLSPTVEVSKNHAAFAARNSATAITHDSNGWYAVELNTTDTGTLGPLIAKFDDAATHLPVWREFLVVPANVYDALVAGADKLEIDAVQWLGTPVATPTVGGVPEVDVTHIDSSTDAAVNLNRSARGIVRGTATTGGTTTSIPTSSLVPAASVTGQFIGRIVVFDKDTPTAALRGQATDILSSTSGGTLGVTALTTAPASGDTFVIL